MSIAPEGWSSDSENDAGFANEVNKKRPSLSLKKRFKLASSDELTEIKKYNPPKNTQVNTKWAMNNFEQWMQWHNCQDGSEACPDFVLSPECSPELINKWLSVYVCETRNKSGGDYPPKTLYSLLTGILRHMKSLNPSYPNFLEKSPEFVEFHRTLDNLFRKLRTDGIGSESKHTPSISIQEENMLWSSGVVNTSTPKGLLRAMFYYNGKSFVLRGGQEHRDLKISQFTRLTHPNRYVYTENSSKNRAGGLAQLRIEHKKVPIYMNAEAGDRCHVKLLDFYLSKLHSTAKERDIFYWLPLTEAPSDPKKPWFTSSPCGKNTLSKMVKELFQESGVTEKKTNHSLRAAGVSQLFEAGVDEKVIQSRSGHRRLESLRMYESFTCSRTSCLQFTYQ